MFPGGPHEVAAPAAGRRPQPRGAGGAAEDCAPPRPPRHVGGRRLYCIILYCTVLYGTVLARYKEEAGQPWYLVTPSCAGWRPR